jgi:hypothetical protein
MIFKNVMRSLLGSYFHFARDIVSCWQSMKLEMGNLKTTKLPYCSNIYPFAINHMEYDVCLFYVVCSQGALCPFKLLILVSNKKK